MDGAHATTQSVAWSLTLMLMYPWAVHCHHDHVLTRHPSLGLSLRRLTRTCCGCLGLSLRRLTSFARSLDLSLTLSRSLSAQVTYFHLRLYRPG